MMSKRGNFNSSTGRPERSLGVLDPGSFLFRGLAGLSVSLIISLAVILPL